LKLRHIRAVAPALLILCSICFAQAHPGTGQIILIVPFENQSKAPGIEWIGDSFPELLEERLDSSSIYVVPREDRIRAYDRVGIPIHLRASRATIYRIAEQLDVDYIVLGEYSFDGRTFTARAQLLDMHREHLLPEMTESAPLTQLIEIETALAWDVLHSLHPELASSKPQYVTHAAPIRLDAFENYIRGVIAPTAAEQIRYFREAVRLNPTYPEALLQLGEACSREHEDAEAISWLARIPESESQYGEANFYLGLAAYAEGNFSQAESAFNSVAAHLPLTEVYNNLGVVTDHRDVKAALAYFQKAVADDPNEPDYRFNLAIVLYQTGDIPGASRQLREDLSMRPSDGDAKTLLDALSTASVGQRPASNLKLPAQRLRTNYEENRFRLLVLKIDAAAEQRLAKADPRTHSRFHSSRGDQLLRQGFLSEAEREFREAISLNPENAEAHAGLANVLESTNNAAGARSEAEEALRWRQFAEPLIVLARLDLRDNRPEAAAEEVDRALRLEPNDASAQELKHTLADRLGQQTQSAPKP
jgi:Flp pilus assembly protein TadD/TolB-like protein